MTPNCWHRARHCSSRYVWWPSRNGRTLPGSKRHIKPTYVSATCRAKLRISGGNEALRFLEGCGAVTRKHDLEVSVRLTGNSKAEPTVYGVLQLFEVALRIGGACFAYIACIRQPRPYLKRRVHQIPSAPVLCVPHSICGTHKSEIDFTTNDCSEL